MTFFPDPYNIGVGILFLSSVDLISNIGLLTEEAITGEPNEKEHISNKYTSIYNDKVETILIGDFCVFDNNKMVYYMGLFWKRRKRL